MKAWRTAHTARVFVSLRRTLRTLQSSGVWDIKAKTPASPKGTGFCKKSALQRCPHLPDPSGICRAEWGRPGSPACALCSPTLPLWAHTPFKFAFPSHHRHAPCGFLTQSHPHPQRRRWRELIRSRTVKVLGEASLLRFP